ncbi:MAG: hypothetical protein M1338_01380 [Patescibacteria group bacterium]|nr:hypothetical protein [Patescibacteria group bacterium]
MIAKQKHTTVLENNLLATLIPVFADEKKRFFTGCADLNINIPGKNGQISHEYYNAIPTRWLVQYTNYSGQRIAFTVGTIIFYDTIKYEIRQIILTPLKKNKVSSH